MIAYRVILLAASVPKGMAPPRYADLVWGTTASLAFVGLTRFLLAREARSPRDVGIALDFQSLRHLLIGLAIGAAVYGATLAVNSLALGPLTFTTPTWPSASMWVLMLASYLALSCMEELGFRAYALRTLAPSIGAWPAQLVIAVAFAASHLLFGWSWLTVVLGVLPSALLFGIVALRSGGVAMPIGVHAALNIAQWLVGAKDVRGVWILSADPAHTARLSAYAPFVGLAVTLLAVAIVARRRPANWEAS